MKKRFFLRRFASVLIDFSVIFCLTEIIRFLIQKVIFIPAGLVLLMTFPVYYFVLYHFLEGRTFGKIFSGIKISTAERLKPGLKSLFLREILFKFFLCAVPLTLTVPLTVASSGLIFINIYSGIQLHSGFSIFLFFLSVLIILISAVFIIFYRTTWWEAGSKTMTVRDETVSRKMLTRGFVAYAITLFACILLTGVPFRYNIKNLGNTWPYPYPATYEVKEMAEYIKKHHQDPVDYIFSLYRKNDIVVISERMHPEYTQYELIFRIISDRRFKSEIGNIFIEAGSVSSQDSLDKYMNSSYTSEDSLNMATARLQRDISSTWPIWTCTNLFELLKTVHRLNNQDNDSNKIRLYLTDFPVNWKTATHDTFVKHYTDIKRDSFMAASVIERFKNLKAGSNNAKALVIMNTYHGYGLAPDGSNNFGSTAGYIMTAFPGKVSNVMLNTINIKNNIHIPLQNGKLDAAFALAGNPEAGFDFAGSPFGAAAFDLIKSYRRDLLYQDVFKGFIFYQPLEKHILKNGFPYEFYQCEDEIIKRSYCVSADKAAFMKGLINFHKKNIYEERPADYFIVYNLIRSILITSILCLLIVITSILYFIKRKTAF